MSTIHQPSSRLYHAFDKLLLLSDGHSIFFGKAADAMGYFHHLGFEPEFATNPADLMLDLANGTTEGISLPPKFDSPEWHKKPTLEQQADVKKVRQRERSSRLDLCFLPQYGTCSPEMRSSCVHTWQLLWCLPLLQFLATEQRELQLPLILGALHALPQATEEEKRAIRSKRGWSAPWTLQFAVLWTRGLKERWHEYLAPLRFYQVQSERASFECSVRYHGLRFHQRLL